MPVAPSTSALLPVSGTNPSVTQIYSSNLTATVSGIGSTAPTGEISVRQCERRFYSRYGCASRERIGFRVVGYRYNSYRRVLPTFITPANKPFASSQPET